MYSQLFCEEVSTPQLVRNRAQQLLPYEVGSLPSDHSELFCTIWTGVFTLLHRLSAFEPCHFSYLQVPPGQHLLL